MPQKCKFFETEKGCRNGDLCPYSHDDTVQEVRLWFLLNKETSKKAKNYCRNLKKKNPNNIKYISVTDNSYMMTKDEHDYNKEYSYGEAEFGDSDEPIEYKSVLFCGESEESIEKCLNEIMEMKFPESQYDYDSKIDYARIRTEDGEVSEYGRKKGILYVI